MHGKFITLEGIEGVGKTTNLNFIADTLIAQGVDVVKTREPGGTPFSESIRDLALHPGAESVATDTELLLMFASRAQHVDQVIKPALAAGKWVVCSRFTDSTRAYQGGGRGVSLDRINDLAHWVHGDLNPDLTILLDAPIEIGMQRARARAELDRIEREEQAFFERVRATFLQLAKTNPHYHIVDATQPLEQVKSDIAAILHCIDFKIN